jgi:hypothetical protein
MRARHVELLGLVSDIKRASSPVRDTRLAMVYKPKDWQRGDCRAGCSVALLEEKPGAMNMFSPKAALAAAAILSLSTIGSAAALPADNLASTAKASVNVQQVAWGFRGGGWRGGGWRGGGWRGAGWRRGWGYGARVGWRGVGWRGGWGWRRPVAWGWRRPVAWGWRRPVAWGWRRPVAWGWRRPLYGFAGARWGWRGAGWRGVGWRGAGWRGVGWRGGWRGAGWRGGWGRRRW